MSCLLGGDGDLCMVPKRELLAGQEAMEMARGGKYCETVGWLGRASKANTAAGRRV